MAKLGRDYDDLDTKHVKLRAKEYDKVDVLRVNAELEGKVKNLQIDIENLICERNALQDQIKVLKQSNSEGNQRRKEVESELEFIRKTHESSMDKFEQKFVEFSQELTELTEQN